MSAAGNDSCIGVDDHPPMPVNISANDCLRTCDLAYGAYLFSGLVVVLVAVISILPVGSNMAGGVGFLLLIPLSVMGLLMISIALWKTVVLANQPVLWGLALLSLLFVIEAVTEFGPPALYNAVTVFYSLVAVLLPLNWFVIVRKKYQSQQ